MLTGGGDCPGLNAVIRAVARASIDHGDEVVGVMRGWRGMIEGQTRPLGDATSRGLLPRGGTILRTSRTNPFESRAASSACSSTCAAWTRWWRSAARTRSASQPG